MAETPSHTLGRPDPARYPPPASDTSKFQYIILDGILKLHGEVRYQDRELRRAIVKLSRSRSTRSASTSARSPRSAAPSCGS
jgi:hypothetical protein